MNFYAFTKGMDRLRLPSKVIIRTMKLIIVILTTCLMQVSASTFGQEINLDARNMPLKEVLESIARQAGVKLVYADALLSDGQKVRISLNNLRLSVALDKVFERQDNLDYELKDNTIVLKKKNTSYFNGIKEAARRLLSANIEVRGKVADSLGTGLPGATVKVERTSKTVYTDKDGNFLISDVAEDDMLEISYIGYVTMTVPVQENMGVITLSASVAKLDEIMVMAYSKTTRRLSTSSSGKVTGDEITRQPVSNPIVALSGRVPGLFITQTAGYAGANVSVNIRGQNSLTLNSAAPLYVVDGVPFGSIPVEKSIGGFSPQSDFSPLNTINPADIESIEVLKDADATSIYGSRGANGVILIVTKKGKPGRTNVTADFSQGFGTVSNQIEMLSTSEYLSVRRQAFANDNLTPDANNAPDLTVWDQNANTDFPDLLIGNTAHQTNASLAVSGGDVYTQFTLGGTYRRETNVYYSSSKDEATQLRLSVQHKSKDSKFHTNASVSYNMDNNLVPMYSLNFTNYGLAPNYPVYADNGSLYWGPGYTNPLAAFNTSNNLKSTNLNAVATLRYNILPGLDIKADGGYNLIDVRGAIITPSVAVNPAYNAQPQSIINNNYIKTYIAEPQVTYALSKGQGKLNLILGGTWQRTETIQPYWILGNFTTMQLVNSLSATTILAKSNNSSDFRYSSAYGRAEYNWDDKYLFSANLRRDGSSKFGPKSRFGTFGSLAAGWIFTKENFVAESLPWLSFGKVRTSYGTIGNDKITDYAYQSTYFSGPAYGTTVTLAPSRIANPSLKWEQTKKLDVSLDLGFLKDRILFNATYFRNRSTDLLGNVPLPAQAGAESYTANLDAVVQNKGFEFELNTVNIAKGAFRWSTSVNLTLPKNKLVSYPGLAASTYNNTYVVGESLNLRTAFKSTGIIDGIATVADVNEDGVITNGIFANGKGDFLVFGNTDPKYYGGINNSFSYKGFQLDVFLQGMSRKATRGDLNFGPYPGIGYNVPKSLLDAGLKYSTNTATPAGSKYYYFTNSDASIETAAYLRLRNLSLSYTLPGTFSKKIGISSLQLYGRGQNLFTITKYKGLDPETLSTQIPPLRMISTGLRATF